MNARDELLKQYGQLHAQILDEIRAWRSDGWRIHRNNEDVTERWLQEQQARADKLGNIIATYEKPPLCIFTARTDLTDVTGRAGSVRSQRS